MSNRDKKKTNRARRARIKVQFSPISDGGPDMAAMCERVARQFDAAKVCPREGAMVKWDADTDVVVSVQPGGGALRLGFHPDTKQSEIRRVLVGRFGLGPTAASLIEDGRAIELRPLYGAW